MAAASLIDGLSVAVGYCDRNAAKLTAVALKDTTPLHFTCSGGVVSYAAWSGLGADHPTRVGETPLFYSKINITGLSPGTLYTWTAAQGADTLTGSFRTMPAEGSDYAFVMSTCEHGEQFSPVDVWQVLEDYCAAQSVPVYFYAHIDDNWYTDSMRFFGYQPGFTQDSATGLGMNSTAVDPQDSGLSWDYCISWLGYFGLLPSWRIPRRTSRLRFMRNMARWTQWGDHEVASNWQRGYGGSGNWYGPSAGYSTLPDYSAVGTANFFDNVAKPNWEALFGQTSPPKLGASGQHWGVKFGALALSAPDMNTFADGRHYLTVGTGAGCGRKADGTVDLGGSGDKTKPYLGTQQITELLNFYDTSAAPFNVMFTANGISSHNEPWAQWWVDDFDDLVRRASVGLMSNSKVNGTSGKLVILKGDSHALHVGSYHADGTAGGLGGSAHTAKELWEICPATINGSATALVTFGTKIQGLKIRYLRSGSASRSHHIHGFVHVTVRETLSPKELEIRLVDTSSGAPSVVWAGKWQANVAGNGFLPISSRRLGV